MQGIYHLQGTVKHYDWGGKNFIPSLLQLPNPGNLPFAEYWLGVHPLGISTVVSPGNEARPLDEVIGDLSFLLKILDVKSMLSIQVHPSLKAAGEEFLRENRENIPLNDPRRNYKDSNHKPELLVALGDFWLLHGFKPAKALSETLQRVQELKPLLDHFANDDFARLYKYIMQMPQEEVNSILQPLTERVLRGRQHNSNREDEEYWVAKAMETFPGKNIDRGIFSIYLFNIVYLKEGEGIFQDAGVPHAYLEGQNVEIMANSDNVLRGGLTTKHIDVPELLKHVKCEATVPHILRQSGKESDYKVPVPDFSLQAYRLEAGEEIRFMPKGKEILLVASGLVTVQHEDQQLQLGAGNPAALISTEKPALIRAIAPATVFRASGTLHKR